MSGQSLAFNSMHPRPINSPQLQHPQQPPISIILKQATRRGSRWDREHRARARAQKGASVAQHANGSQCAIRGSSHRRVRQLNARDLGHLVFCLCCLAVCKSVLSSTHRNMRNTRGLIPNGNEEERKHCLVEAARPLCDILGGVLGAWRIHTTFRCAELH
ncbi:hypothetical protein PENSPDRAFT_107811 [Peniophora sp. CONT]|nr:hypothetical protein PENSPDRAFT_107811 [Peniophora sp. CONT]